MIRGPSQMAKKEFEKGDEVLLLSSNKGPHCSGRYLCPYVVTESTRGHIESLPTREGGRRKCVM